jgi:hypothetical protein
VQAAALVIRKVVMPRAFLAAAVWLTHQLAARLAAKLEQKLQLVVKAQRVDLISHRIVLTQPTRMQAAALMPNQRLTAMGQLKLAVPAWVSRDRLRVVMAQ